MKKLIYLAGPITNGGEKYNWAAIRHAEEVAVTLEARGYAVHCPQSSARWPGADTIPWQSWVESGKAWVKVCDAVLRLPGESMGADLEVDYADAKGIPVVGSIEDLDKLFKEKRDGETD